MTGSLEAWVVIEGDQDKIYLAMLFVIYLNNLNKLFIPCLF